MPPKILKAKKVPTVFKVKPSHNFVDKNPHEAPPAPVQRHNTLVSASSSNGKKRVNNKAKTLPRSFSLKTNFRGMEDFY